MQKVITINGKTYPVAFNMKAIMNYEELNKGQSFFGENFTQMKPRIALIISAVLAADEDTDLTVEELLKGETWEEVQAVITAYNTIMEMIGEFFHIPEVEKSDDDQTDEEEGKQAKN
jgi:hypothetical protein